jgi:hypothetical protein
MSNADVRTIGMVAAEVGEPRWRLAYWIERGVLPAPSVQVPGRRLFTAEDIRRIRAALPALKARARRTERPCSPVAAPGHVDGGVMD